MNSFASFATLNETPDPKRQTFVRFTFSFLFSYMTVFVVGVLTLIRCPFHPCVTAVARKRPRSFCQKCWWQVTLKHAYTLDAPKSEWADYAAAQAECGNLSGNELTRNSSGNTQLRLSQLAYPLWTDPGLKSGISVHELISNNK